MNSIDRRVVSASAEDKSRLPMKDARSGLFPFRKTGTVDVSGGHHDAGDYGKYTFNSAQLVHELVFAIDYFPGVAELDNLGLPESSDGVGDVIQIAKREADFLVKMQDDDGGFFALVQPRDRAYEQDTQPDKGDPQVVFPKGSVQTAAAVAALAQAGSSPAMSRAFPSEAATYLRAALKGWAMLRKAESQLGRGSTFQKVHHYGQEFGDSDEIVWAATEIFLATGDPEAHRVALDRFDPENPKTRRWGWWRMFESYGAAARSYALAQASSRPGAKSLDPEHLAKCRREAIARARDLVEYGRASAYGTSFPSETKRFRAAGWYFSGANAFDLVVGYQLDERDDLLSAAVHNFDFELGSNPPNIVFLTGAGWNRQREIVYQQAQSDPQILPPSGIPLGAVQAGFVHIDPYGDSLRELTYPSDTDSGNPYPPYDRWADTFNVTTEFTVDTQGRALAAASFLMARSPLRDQPYRALPAKLVVTRQDASRPELDAQLEVQGADPAQAQVVWEQSGIEPWIGGPRTKLTVSQGAGWAEAEALWPDGRRAFAVMDSTKRP